MISWTILAHQSPSA